MKKNALHSLLTCFAAIFLLFQVVHAQDIPTIQPKDYDKWESFSGYRLSPDGQWLAYIVTRVDERSELRIVHLQTDSIRIVPNASSPTFSDDNSWLAYTIGVSPEEREKKQKKNEPVKKQMGLLNLKQWEEKRYDAVARFTFDKSGHYLTMLGYSPEGGKVKTASLMIVHLNEGTQINFGDVLDFAWSDSGSLLAISVMTESGNGNGVQLYRPTEGVIRVLESSGEEYRGFSWREDADDLSVFCKSEGDSDEEERYRIFAWQGLANDSYSEIVFDPSQRTDFPKEKQVVEHRPLHWAKDGSQIYFGIQDRPVPEPDSISRDTTKMEKSNQSDVMIWHASDLRIIPRQRSRAEADKKTTLLSLWNLSQNRFLGVGTMVQESVQVLNGDLYATETDSEPYPFGAMFGRPYEDIYLTDLKSGGRKKIIEHVRYFFGSSPEGRYLLYFQGQDYWTYDLKSGKSTNITTNVKTQFANLEYDYPVEQYPPYRIAGWLKNDEAVLLYDKYDIWRVTPDGRSSEKLTTGTRDKIIHRYLKLDPEAEAIDPEAYLYLALFGEKTKASGFARMKLGTQSKVLLLEDQSLGSLQKARDAEIYLFSAQSFSDCPDLYMAGPELKKPRQVTNLNPFQENYAWGKSEIIDFQSTGGKALQAALYYPANYEPGRKYPMIVYNYEILSDQVHRYHVPSLRSYYNFSVFTSQGYFVLAPDIVYRPRDPGRSAVEAIEGAVKAVTATGKVDPERVGLVGHSWGGYQATYVPTQTDIFAAAVAGAPITNFLSFMGAIHWNPGIPEVDHWETGQARMEVPYWEDFDAHVRNSPAAFVHQLNTPMLMAFGDADGVVDWHQGVEFYNFARRAGKKDFVLLVYPGEDHGIGRKAKEDAIDYHKRILAWFGHYLKGEEAETWITKGMSYLDYQKEIEKN